METVIVTNNQTLTDIAIQVYGEAERVIELAVINDLSITADLEPGQTLSYNKSENLLARYWESKNIRISTKTKDNDNK